MLQSNTSGFIVVSLIIVVEKSKHIKCNLLRVVFCVSDTKNSVGLVGCIEEVAHNAIAIYWNPMESPAKVITVPIEILNSYITKYFTD